MIGDPLSRVQSIDFQDATAGLANSPNDAPWDRIRMIATFGNLGVDPVLETVRPRATTWDIPRSCPDLWAHLRYPAQRLDFLCAAPQVRTSVPLAYRIAEETPLALDRSSQDQKSRQSRMICTSI